MWKKYLYSKLIDKDFHNITSNSVSQNATLKYILGMTRERKLQNVNGVEFQFIDGNNIVIGINGLAKDVLPKDQNGNDHYFGYERAVHNPEGRAIPFTLAYVASMSTKIPDIEEVKRAMRADLEDLLKRAHAGEKEIEQERAFETEGIRQPGTAWDNAAKEIEQGRREYILIADGERREPQITGPRAIEHRKTDRRSERVLQSEDAIGRSAEKKTPNTAALCFMAVTAVGLVATFAIWAWRKIRGRRQAEEDKLNPATSHAR